MQIFDTTKCPADLVQQEVLLLIHSYIHIHIHKNDFFCKTISVTFHMDAKAYLTNSHAIATYARFTLFLVFECMSQQ